MDEYPKKLLDFIASIKPGDAATIPNHLLTPALRRKLAAPPPVDRIFQMMRTNASNRDLVLESVDRIDKLLTAHLAEKFAQPMRDQLFGKQRKLRDFALKLDLAYGLGVLREHEYQEINKLREIRNQFAHDADLLKFEHSDKVISITESLKVVNFINVPLITLRDRFAVSAIEWTIPLTAPPSSLGPRPNSNDKQPAG